MTSPQKRKGSRAERQLADTLIANGWPCERIPAGATEASGVGDRGDLWVPIIEWPSIDVKDHATHSLGAWSDRAQVQAVNAGRVTGSVVWKRRGKANPLDWFWIFPVRGYLDLMEQFR